MGNTFEEDMEELEIYDVLVEEEKTLAKRQRRLKNKLETKREGTTMPRRATENSAGYDFYSPTDIVIAPHSISELIDTGIALRLDERKVMMLYIRSSLGINYGISLANGTGIIDSDYYPNTIKCRLRNDSNEEFVLKKGERFMQGVIVKYYKVYNDIEPSEKREEGIGSTGK